MNSSNKVFCFVCYRNALLVQQSVRIYLGVIFFLFLSVVPINIYSQNKYTDNNSFLDGIGRFINGHDSLYIDKVKENYTFSLKNTGWFDSYSLSENETGLFFKSDLKYNIGPVVGYKFLVLSYSVNASDLFSGEKSLSRQLNFNVFTNRFSLETSFLKNNGSTRIVRFKQNGETTELDMPFQGLESANASLDILYYWNYRKYSNNANYSNGHNFIQLKNAGSLILSCSYMMQNINIDFSGLKGTDINMNTDQFKVRSKIYFLGAGYGYNYLVNKNLLVNLSVIPSLGFRYGKDADKSFNGDLSYNTNAKIAVNYNLHKYLIGFTAQHDDTFEFLDNYTYDSSLTIFNVFGCIRF